MTNSPLDRFEALVAHSERLRRLARSLAGQEADDLIHDAYIAALDATHPARFDPTAWLAGIVRRLSGRRRRSDSRRLSRERRVARPESTVSAADLAAEIDLHRRLAEAVLALEPIYRDVILLRFFEGHSVKDTATRLGISADGVHWRQSRALDRLRAALDRTFLGRDAWTILIPGVFEAIGDSGAAWEGALVMTAKTKAIGAVSAAIILVTIFWSLNTDSVDFPTDARLTSQASERTTTAVRRESASGTGRTAASIDDQFIFAEAPTSTEPSNGSSIGPSTTVVVVETTGAPVPGASVVVRDEGSEARDLDEAALARWRGELTEGTRWFEQHGLRLTTDAEGRARVADFPKRFRAVAVTPNTRGECRGLDADGIARITVFPVETIDVDVVDELGNAVGGIEVCAISRRLGRYDVVVDSCRTDDKGSASLRFGGNRLHERLVALQCAIEPFVSRAIAADAGSERVRLTLPANGSAAVAVRMSDGSIAPDGTPVVLTTSEAMARGRFMSSLPALPYDVSRVDNGVARFGHVPLGGRLRALVRTQREAMSDWIEFDGPTVPGANVEIRLELDSVKRTFTGRATTVHGEPMVGRSINVMVRGIEELSSTLSTRVTDAEGRFSFTMQLRLPAPKDFVLDFQPSDDVRPDTAVPIVIGQYSLREEVVNLGDVVLRPPPVIVRGTVVDAENLPVAKARVFVLDSAMRRGAPAGSVSAVETDEFGQFSLPTPEYRPSLRLCAVKGASLFSDEVAFAHEASDVKLVLKSATSLEIHLLLPDGARASDIVTVLWDRRQGAWPVDSAEWRFSYACDRERSFIRDLSGGGERRLFTQLRPGNYDVVAFVEGATPIVALAVVDGVSVEVGRSSKDARLNPWDLRGAVDLVEFAIGRPQAGNPPLSATIVLADGQTSERRVATSPFLISSRSQAIGVVFQSTHCVPRAFSLPNSRLTGDLPYESPRRVLLARTPGTDSGSLFVEISPKGDADESIPDDVLHILRGRSTKSLAITEGPLELNLADGVRYEVSWFVAPRTQPKTSESIHRRRIGHPRLLIVGDGDVTLDTPTDDEIDAALR